MIIEKDFSASKWILTTDVHLLAVLMSKDGTEQNDGIVSYLRLQHHESNFSSEVEQFRGNY